MSRDGRDGCSLRVLAADPCRCGRCDGAPYYWEIFRAGARVNGGVARTDGEARRLAWLHVTVDPEASAR